MRTTSIAVMIIFLWKGSFRKFKVLSEKLQSTLTTGFERHITIKDFTDMDQHRCGAAPVHLTYCCKLLFLSDKPSF